MSTKRSLGLEDYASSEDEEELLPAPPAKRRKLPALAQSIVIQRPVDDPALHQGRIRSSPFVEGQWAAYVYAPIRLGPRSPLRRFLSDVITHSKDLAPTLHSSVDAKNGDRDIELHISLTRPIYLRAHQREELRRSVKRIAESNAPFKASFATFSALNNDENTRTFLTLEVGAGHETLSILANSLNPVLSALRQQGYYSKPRFHASIAWGLLDSLKGNEAQSSDSSPKTDLSTTLPKAPPSPSENVSAAKSEIETALFPTIPCLPPSLIPNLIEKYGLDLVSPKVGSFEVGSIVVQIGKDTSEWNLGDIR